jgi:hypothetical protein
VEKGPSHLARLGPYCTEEEATGPQEGTQELVRLCLGGGSVEMQAGQPRVQLLCCKA